MLSMEQHDGQEDLLSQPFIRVLPRRRVKKKKKKKRTWREERKSALCVIRWRVRMAQKKEPAVASKTDNLREQNGRVKRAELAARIEKGILNTKKKKKPLE